MGQKGGESRDREQAALHQWLQTTETLKSGEVVVDRLSGDVSPRRYFRISTADSGACQSIAIAVHYPTDMVETSRRFEITSHLLEQVGVRVPKVLETSADGRWMLVEDLGRKTLFDRRGEGDRWLRVRVAAAARIPTRIQRIDARRVTELNPPLDGQTLAREIDQTWEVYLTKDARLDRGEGLGRELSAALDQINSDLGTGPLVPCHRDFMLRNLLPLDDGRIGVIDHQDLRLGPDTYDLASLFNDSLSLPASMLDPIRELVLPADRQPHYYRCVVQRCFKIVGTFKRFAARGERRHLPMIPGAIERALTALEKLDDLDGPSLSRDLTAHFE